MSDINERIGRLVAKKEGRCFHEGEPVKSVAGIVRLTEPRCKNCEEVGFSWDFRPDYEHDLNAVAEARRVLLDTDEKRARFFEVLSDIRKVVVSEDEEALYVGLRCGINATAREQCLAILEALGEGA